MNKHPDEIRAEYYRLRDQHIQAGGIVPGAARDLASRGDHAGALAFLKAAIGDGSRTFGPYENERQAMAEPMPQAVRALHDAGQVKSGDPDHLVRDTIAGHLLRACDDAGVDLGAYDRRVLVGLAIDETSTCQVLIGLITRAYAAGREAAR